jgi:hypothetical protein
MLSSYCHVPPTLSTKDGILEQPFFVDVSGHKLDYYQTRVLSSFLPLFFLLYKMLFMNRLEFSCFADFFALFGVEYDFV